MFSRRQQRDRLIAISRPVLTKKRTDSRLTSPQEILGLVLEANDLAGEGNLT